MNVNVELGDIFLDELNENCDNEKATTFLACMLLPLSLTLPPPWMSEETGLISFNFVYKLLFKCEKLSKSEAKQIKDLIWYKVRL